MYSHLHIKEERKVIPSSHSHQVIPSRPVIPSAARNLHLRIHTKSFRASSVIPSTARNLPPSQCVRGPGGCPHVILAQAGIQRAREGKIMAIFPPSWQSWFKTSPLRIHTKSFRAPPVIPSGARNLPLRKARGMRTPPFAQRKGPGGCMPGRGRDGKITAIMVQKLPPSQSVRGTRQAKRDAGGCPATPILSILYIHVNFSPENS